MFNIGAGELFIIFLVAFVVVGPKDLPKVIQGIKKALTSTKKLVKDLKAESGWDEIVKEVTETKEDVSGAFSKYDITKEIKDAKKSIEESVSELDLRKDFEEAKSALKGEANSLKSAAESILKESEPEAAPKPQEEAQPETSKMEEVS